MATCAAALLAARSPESRGGVCAVAGLEAITTFTGEACLASFPLSLQLLLGGSRGQGAVGDRDREALLRQAIGALRAVPDMIGVEGLLQRCLLSVRHELPAGMWSMVA
jgi:hypothetical protein